MTYTRRQALGIGAGGALVGAAAATGLPRLYDALVGNMRDSGQLEQRIARHVIMLGEKHGTAHFSSEVDLKGKVAIVVVKDYGTPQIENIQIIGPDQKLTHSLRRGYAPLYKHDILDDDKTDFYMELFAGLGEHYSGIDATIGTLTPNQKRELKRQFAADFLKIDEALNAAIESKRIKAEKIFGTK